MFGGFGFNSLCPAPSIPSADEKTRRLSEPRHSLREGGVSFGASDPINRSMQQASCCQARRQVKRGAQQSTDCEHPSKRENTAWRHEAPLHRPVGRCAGLRGTRACSFASFSVTGQKMKNSFSHIGLEDRIGPGLPPEVANWGKI
jgi:hypothetical protein